MSSSRPLPTGLPAAVPDMIGPDLHVLFCGINPGTLTGTTGYHFARPGNRFWSALHQSGFTPRQLAPSEQGSLVPAGIGITNLVGRTTATASELSTTELRDGAVRLEATARTWNPLVVAVLGMQAYRTAFRRPRAAIGPQPERIAHSALWLLPNPSGLQARYQLPDIVEWFAALRLASAS